MRRKRSTTHSAAQQPRPSRRVPSSGEPEKLADVTGSPKCGASYREGRWTWQSAPAGSSERLCPACERITYHYPAGVLHVEGGFAALHRDDLIGLLRNVEERERSNHPLKRIMSIEQPPTTADKENLVRVRWVRD
jgi:hypothetical protein